LEIIKDWLFSMVPPGHRILEDALEEEWFKIVSYKYKDLTNANFFLKGGYIDLVVGALGEF
jgi:hypothetical protein